LAINAHFCTHARTTLIETPGRWGRNVVLLSAS
jgi:hypothetical protein